MKSSLKGYLLIIISSLCWGLSATLVKAVLQKTDNPLILSQTRVSISAIIIFIYFIINNREKLKIDKNDIVKFFFTGIFGLAGSNYFYYAAIKESTVANAILVQYCAPIIVAVYSVIFLKEKFNRNVILSMIVSTVGIYLAIGGFDFNLSSSAKNGLMFAVFAAFSFATFTLSAKNILKKYSGITSMFYTLVAASIFWLIVNSPEKIIAANYNFEDWSLFGLIAITSILIPYACFFYGLSLLSPTKVLITSTSEPVFAIISEIIFLGAAFSGYQAVGATLVIVSIVILTLSKNSNGNRN